MTIENKKKLMKAMIVNAVLCGYYNGMDEKNREDVIDDAYASADRVVAVLDNDELAEDFWKGHFTKNGNPS